MGCLYVLRTNKPSRLLENELGELYLSYEVSIGGNNHFHIYITADVPEQVNSGYDHLFSKRIIITSDQDLIDSGVQAITQTVAEWIVDHQKRDGYVEVKSIQHRLYLPLEDVMAYRSKYPKLQHHHSSVVSECYIYRVVIPKDSYTKEDMLDFAWWLSNNMGEYADDMIAHFEGKYLEQFKLR